MERTNVGLNLSVTIDDHVLKEVSYTNFLGIGIYALAVVKWFYVECVIGVFGLMC